MQSLVGSRYYITVYNSKVQKILLRALIIDLSHHVRFEPTIRIAPLREKGEGRRKRLGPTEYDPKRQDRSETTRKLT